MTFQQDFSQLHSRSKACVAVERRVDYGSCNRELHSMVLRSMRSLSFFFVLVALGFAYGCGPSPEGAREELDERGYDYSRQGLVEAVRDDDREAIELFISAGFNFSRSAGQAAIGVASEEGYNDMVRLLVDAGAKPDTEVLERTVEEGDWELSEILLEAGAKPSVAALESALEAFEDEDANEKVMQMLSYADGRLPAQFLEVVSGRLDEEYAEELVEALLDSGVRPSGDALERAAESGNTAAMTMLLEAGAKPSGRVLEIAIESQDLELVSILLEAGARLDGGALAKAIDIGDYLLVEQLIEEGAKVNAEALAMAIEIGDTTLVDMLLEAGATADTAGLELAVLAGNAELVEQLISAGAKPNAAILERAVIESKVEIIGTLLDAGAQPNLQLLTRAVHDGNGDVAELLANAGVKANQELLRYAVKESTPRLVELLLGTGVAPTGDLLGYASRSPNQEMRSILAEALATWRSAVQKRWNRGAVFTDSLLSGGQGPRMVVIPDGEFLMGCVTGRDCQRHERPVHKVEIPLMFALSRREITFAQWRTCVAAGGCRGYMPDDQGWGRGDTPVINVSWNDAQSYVSWLSKETGEQYRLPSEAEWEFAARAGSETAYSWGNGIGANQANCNRCGSPWSGKSPAPVGSFEPNSFGLQDMHGNVWEWTQDCRNDSYGNAPADGSAWLSGNCRSRVLRGGSWNYRASDARSANRASDSIRKRNVQLGIRIARTLTP